MNRALTLVGAVAFGAVMTIAAPKAMAVSCVDAGTTGADTSGIILTTIGGTSGFSQEATACHGPVSGNDTGAQGTLIPNLEDGTFFDTEIDDAATFTLIGKSDDGIAEVTADNGERTGVWSADFGMDVTQFVLTLKAGNDYTAFLFEVGNAASTFAGTFDTLLGGLPSGNPNNGKDLSHLTAVKVVGPDAVVPVPLPLALLLTGIAGIGLVARRRA